MGQESISIPKNTDTITGITSIFRGVSKDDSFEVDTFGSGKDLTQSAAYSPSHRRVRRTRDADVGVADSVKAGRMVALPKSTGRKTGWKFIPRNGAVRPSRGGTSAASEDVKKHDANEERMACQNGASITNVLDFRLGKAQPYTPSRIEITGITTDTKATPANRYPLSGNPESTSTL